MPAVVAGHHVHAEEPGDDGQEAKQQARTAKERRRESPV
jgi:hypothetical protein